MDHRIVRGIVNRQRDQLGRSASETIDRLVPGALAITRPRFAAGKRLRPEDSLAVGVAARKAMAGQPAVVASWERSAGVANAARLRKGSALDLLVAEPVQYRIDHTATDRPSPYIEDVVILRGLSLEWDRRRLRFADSTTFIEFAEHLQRRFVERAGQTQGGDALARTICSAVGVMVATGIVSRELLGNAAPAWPIVAPLPQGICMGAATVAPITMGPGTGMQFVADENGEREVPFQNRAAFGLEWLRPDAAVPHEGHALLHSLRTFVDNDATRPAQEEVHAGLLPLVERHADCALAEIRAGYVAFAPMPEGTVDKAACEALLGDVRRVMLTGAGRQVMSDAALAWSHSARGRMIRKAEAAGGAGNA